MFLRLYIHTYACTSVRPPMAIWSQPQGDLERMAVRTYVQTDVLMYRLTLYSAGLCLLRFPLELPPCSHNSYRYKILKQGKGTDDHLLPLGHWLSMK